MAKRKENDNETLNMAQEPESKDFETQINDLKEQIEYLKNIIQTQQGTIINQKQQQMPKEFVVISMFNGVLGLKTRPEQKAPAIMLNFKETYTLRSESELQDFYLSNRSAFINKYLLFESPAAAETLHIQDDIKNQ